VTTHVGERPGRRRHVAVIHRFAGPAARYEQYLDHGKDAVSYVVTPASRASCPAALAAAVEVVATSGELVATEGDLAAYRQAVERLARRHGSVDRLVALYEGDLLAAAQVRSLLGIPGTTPGEVLPFRDKLVMAERLQGCGIHVPATVPVAGPADVRAFAAEHGWPVFLKPRASSASLGTRKVDGAGDLDDQGIRWADDLVAQPFVEGAVLHVDGIWTGSGLGAWRASRYENTCYDHALGATLGSVELDRGTEDVERAASAVLGRLTARPVVFHLELFAAGPGSGDLAFLEIGARPGGAEIPYVWRETHGIDLAAVAVALELGDDVSVPPVPLGRPEHSGADVGGWLIVPPDLPKPCTVVRADSQLGRNLVVAETVPRPGTVMSSTIGYETTGARFRFQGRTCDEVRAAVLRVAAEFRLECRPPGVDTIVLVGSGGQAYREYGFASLRGRARIVLLDPDGPGWARRHADEHHLIPRADADTVAALVRSVVERAPGRVGIMTWDETLVELTAAVAERCGLPGIGVAAARACRDKAMTRDLLARAGVSPVRSVPVQDLRQAREAATAVGFPVVVKPQALAGSAGVVRVDDLDRLEAGYRVASGARFPGLASAGCLVEEYLDGPEISVDCVVAAGRVECINVARKQLGFGPYAEEIGHLVAPWRHESWWPATEQLVHDAHAVLGVGTGITHVELRLTGAGPRIVEVNCRLGGDFIPYLGTLANGVDQVVEGLRVALGETAVEPVDDAGCCGVAFVYPARDGVVERIDVGPAAASDGVRLACPLAVPGQELLLPPRGVVPRVAAVVVREKDPAACGRALERAAARVAVELRSRPGPVPAAIPVVPCERRHEVPVVVAAAEQTS
jgi:biotin carboxylase